DGFAGVGIAFAAGSSGGLAQFNLVENVYAGIYLSTAASDIDVLQNAVRNLAGSTADQGAAIVFEGSNTNVLVSENVLTDNAIGIYAWNFGSDFSGTRIFNNNLGGNAQLVTSLNSGTLDASGNWWGSNSVDVIASKMSGSVDFTPFLDSGTDTDVHHTASGGAVTGTAGFQGDF